MKKLVLLALVLLSFSNMALASKPGVYCMTPDKQQRVKLYLPPHSDVGTAIAGIKWFDPTTNRMSFNDTVFKNVKAVDTGEFRGVNFLLKVHGEHGLVRARLDIPNWRVMSANNLICRIVGSLESLE